MNKVTQAQIKSIGSGMTYPALVSLVDEMCANWGSGHISEEGEFKYLKACFERDGKMLGAKAVLREIERITNE